MRTMLTAAAIAITAALTTAAEDDGKASWAEGYPKAGPKAGEVVVKGAVKPQTGFKLVSAVAHVWPEQGGETKVVNVPLTADGVFGPTTVPGLAAGGRYNVIVMVTEDRDGNEQLRGPPLVVVKAP